MVLKHKEAHCDDQMSKTNNTYSIPYDLSAPLPVVERFISINGEGRQAGKLAAFVRFAGCNLKCSYCDTSWANVSHVPHEDLSVSDVVAYVRAAQTECITLTGGEPLLQSELPTLVHALLALPIEASAPMGRWIEIETNGSVSLEPLCRIRESLQDQGIRGQRGNQLSFTMDYKGPSSGMEHKMCRSNFDCLESCDTVKFVVGSQEDLVTMAHVVRQYSLTDRCAVFVSPVFGVIDPAEIVDFIKDQKLARVCLQVQLHKVLWPQCEKGV